jgi:hypothetical protein
MNLPFYHALYLAIRENNKQLIEAKKSRYEGAMLLGDEQSFLDGFIDSMYSFYRYARGDATLLEKSYVREQKRLNSTQRDSYNYSYNGAKFLGSLNWNASSLLGKYQKFIGILPKLVKHEQYAFFAKFICNIDADDIAANALMQDYESTINKLCSDWRKATNTLYIWGNRFEFGYGPEGEKNRNNAQLGMHIQTTSRECIDTDTDKKYTKRSTLISFKFHPEAMNSLHDSLLAEMMIECNISFHGGMSIQDFYAEARLEINKLKRALEKNQQLVPKFHNSIAKWSDEMLKDRFKSVIKSNFTRDELEKLKESFPQLSRIL